MDGDDSGMRKLADDSSFAKKMIAGIATGELRGKELDGDGAVNQRVVPANDAAVGADSKSFVDLITSDLHV
jgi:hypothetical protein